MPPPTTHRPTHRNPRIDILRGVAILMVMILHFSDTYRLWDTGPLQTTFGDPAVFAVIGWSNFGVTLFFVISGYLITSNALNRYGALRHIPLRSFYVQRLSRLEPLLLIALAIIVTLGLFGLAPFKQPNEPTADILLGALSVLTFWHNILMQRLGYFNYCLNIYWSLSVEDLFYLIFPIACILLRKTWLIAALCLILIAIAPWYRAHHMHSDIFYLYANVSCFDAIAIGCLCALATPHITLQPRTALILRIGATIAIIALWLNGFGSDRKIYSFTLLALAAAILILASRSGPPPKWSDTHPARAIRWLGRHSYELYLFHIIILATMRDIIPYPAMGYWPQLPWLILFLTLSATTAALAALAARHIGDPANRALRTRFDPHPKP
ncbi:acyltransferase [Acidiphilium sp. PA]|uniref:acyltransferase family protein n=1 Tax=Acidiphilium sp. PA TaxID=2871705 RepID=UPI00224304CD|nr:acyltransferase [Acidiphilium sp. PA]MCW8306936.1 acyltransferase [Acidiphilium sp. PA]